jgi:cytidine deaminase
MEYKKLVEMAYEAMENAYVPYSNFNVGAALLTKSGKVYTGCNVECASYGATNCAERTAIFKAVSEGEKEFAAIAIVSRTKDITYPCGICRQVISEFADGDLDIILAKDMEYKVFKLSEMMPFAFDKSELDK